MKAVDSSCKMLKRVIGKTPSAVLGTAQDGRLCEALNASRTRKWHPRTQAHLGIFGKQVAATHSKLQHKKLVKT